MILLMGMAGTGKGTQGKLLADQLGRHLISMGDVLRMYVTGKKREEMLAGKLLKDEEIIKFLKRVLSTLRDDEGVILDGFPRTISQAEWLLNQKEHSNARIAFHLVASRDTVKQRMIERARSDDTEDAIEKRIDEYDNATKPLLDWLQAHGVKVVNINAEQPIAAVNKEILKHLK